MRVLTVNPGSSSVKLAVIENDAVLDQTSVATASAQRSRRPLLDLVRRWAPVDAVGVRFVHGGRRTEPIRLGDKEIARLTALTPLAPLHQPSSLALAALAEEIAPGTVFACFDTAFHTGIPEAAARYALPANWVREHDLRRYGFHGLSCAYALRRTAELLNTEPRELRVVCCHLGAGVSVTAIRGARSVDTSMGFTPLEGAVMATRSGSVDPGLLMYLLRAGITEAAGLEDTLEHSSGLAGMTGTGGDIRDVLAARADGRPEADLAIEVYLHRLRHEIGAMTAALDRLDALVFTGGVAEHQPGLIAELAAKLGIFDVRIDPDRLPAPGDRVLSPVRAGTRVVLVTAREDLELAKQTEAAAVGPRLG
ncbi:acetate kinase [Amycolatopsis minnesotensis]|uniref:Acetate kinase n=1 Tax=Amycolatopsis minnesotensis TaxID=337894 RepID=A0ABN2R9Q3_9PSEU